MVCRAVCAGQAHIYRSFPECWQPVPTVFLAVGEEQRQPIGADGIDSLEPLPSGALRC